MLRGLAIAGTLGTNIWGFAWIGSEFEVLFSPKQWWAGLDEFLLTFTLFLTNGKFLGLLAILFGVGLEMQRQSASRRGHGFLARYGWRNLLLFGIGFAHFALVYGYDILMGYALAALLVMFLANGGRLRLFLGLAVAGLMHVLLYGALSLQLPPAGTDIDPAITAAANQALTEGSFLDAVAFRLDNAAFYRFEVVTLLGLNTVLFGIGVGLVRLGLFDGNARAFFLARRMVLIGLVVGIPLNLAVFAQDARLIFAARYFFAPFLSLLYLGLGVLLFHAARGWLGNGLAGIGRTALSCYILQNLLAAAIFYGWGLGLRGSLGAFETLLAWLAITAAYGLLASLWLRHFRQGPVEAAWRMAANAPFRAR